MDAIPGRTTHSKWEKQISLQISNTTTQEPPDITHTPPSDMPPPLFMKSITELRTFSTALSEFLCRFDELHSHFNIIKSSIDSKLPNQIVNDCPELTVSNQNPKQGVSDFERSRESERTPDSIGFSQNFEEVDNMKKSEVVDVSNNHEELDVGTNASIINTSKKRKFADVSKNHEEIDVSKRPVDINTSKKPEVVDDSKNPVEIDAFKNPVEADVLKNIGEIVESEKHAESDTSKKPEETVPESSCDQTITIDVSKRPVENNTSKKPEVVDDLKNPVEIDALKNPNIEETVESKKHAESDTSKKPEETVPEISCDQTITAVPDTIVPEQNPNGIGTNCEQIYDNARMPENLEEIDVPEKSEQTDILNKPEEIDILKKNEQTDICKNTEESDVLQNPEEINTSVNHEEIDVLHKPEEFESEQTDILNKPEEIDILKKNEQTYNCKNTEESDALQNPEEINNPVNHEEIDVLHKPEEFDSSMDWEEIDTVMNAEEDDHTSKNNEEIDMMTKPEQTDICKKPEEIDTLKKHEKTGICKKAKEIDVLRKHEKTETSNKSVVSALETLCQTQSLPARKIKWYVASHYSQMKQLHKEIAKVLKRVKNPANLVLNSIGRFFTQSRRTFRKDLGLGSHQYKENEGRLASVLILECFVMISDGIKIGKEDQVYAVEAAVDWRKRMIKEGGLRHTDEIDAKGLLFLISGFKIQDHVFKIRDIADLILVSNVKGISPALRCSVFLIRKISEVVNWMVKDNLEIEAADLAFTFRLENKCDPRNILTKYVHKKIKDIQNATSFQMLKEQLSDLKSVKQCLESHSVDPSMLLPNLDKEIENLDQEINERNLIQKRKSLENPIRHESKRARFSHENMRYQQEPIDHYGNRSPQPRTRYVDFDRNRSNSYINDYSPSPDRPAGGYTGSYDQMVHPANVQPYGWHEPYGQHYTRYCQTYDTQPYGRPSGFGTPESSTGFRDILPSSGFPGRRGPSSYLYGFADIVEKESRGFRSSGSNGA